MHGSHFTTQKIPLLDVGDACAVECMKLNKIKNPSTPTDKSMEWIYEWKQETIM